jgi:hypothetical protein
VKFDFTRSDLPSSVRQRTNLDEKGWIPAAKESRKNASYQQFECGRVLARSGSDSR